MTIDDNPPGVIEGYSQITHLGDLGPVRTNITSNGRRWYCGKDVITGLDYSSTSAVCSILKNIPKEWVDKQFFETEGGPQLMRALCEEGINYLLERSNKLPSHPYKRLLASNIPPSVLKPDHDSIPMGDCQPAPPLGPEGDDMNDLILVTHAFIGGAMLPTVDGRYIHGRLGIDTDFRHWIKRRIESGDLEENVDFAMVRSDHPEITNNPKPPIDYHLTLQAAMKIAIAEKTPKALELRDELVALLIKYATTPAPAPMDDDELMSRALILANRRLEASEAKVDRLTVDNTALIEVNATQAAKIEADAPLVDFAKLYAEADKLFLVADLAKDITIHIGVRFSEITLFRYLRSRGVVHIAGSEYNMPTQGYIDRGYMTIKTTVKTVGAYDEPRVFRTPAITTTGMIYFMTKFRRLAEKGQLSESDGIKLIPPPKADE